MTQRTKRPTKAYQPAALFRVFDKNTGAVLGYAAPSRDGSKTYHVTCDSYGHWHCDCAASVECCCHVKVAQELCEIRVKAGRSGCRQPVVSAETAPEIREQVVTSTVEEINARAGKVIISVGVSAEQDEQGPADKTSVPAGLMELQAKDFVKWLRKQVRQCGRKAEVGNENDCPVEVWLAELGYQVKFIAGGEVEIYDGTERTLLMTDWTSASYYMFRDDGHMEVKAGKWLDIMTQCENPEAYLISQTGEQPQESEIVTADRDESNEEATLSGWTDEALMLHASLNGNLRNQTVSAGASSTEKRLAACGFLK